MGHSSLLKVLSEGQIRQIHSAVLGVLARTGVDVHHPEAIGLLGKAGCRVVGRRVYFPAALVEECIQRAPSRIVIYDRQGSRAMLLAAGKVHFGLGSDTIYAYDPWDGIMKYADAQSVARAAKVGDACRNIDYLMSLGIVNDVPQTVNDLVQFQQQVENSTKPICFTAHHRDNLRTIVDMASVVVGGLEHLRHKPFVIHYSEPNSPLMLTEPATDKLLLCAELSIPLLFTPGSMAGATAPITKAGSLVVSIAEALSGLVVHQLKNPGAPIISGGNSMVMDLQTAICFYGAPEFRLCIAAFTQVFHHYRLPVWGFAGCSDAHLLDEQAALEATFSIMMNALAGTNLIHDVGYLSSGKTASCELVVLSDEIIAMVKRILGGVPVDDETLGLDAIDRVGPGGHFVTDEHTLEHMHAEYWQPGLLNRLNLDQWRREGELPLRTRLNGRVKQILEKHSSVPLAESIRKRLDQHIHEAEERNRNL